MEVFTFRWPSGSVRVRVWWWWPEGLAVNAADYSCRKVRVQMSQNGASLCYNLTALNRCNKDHCSSIFYLPMTHMSIIVTSVVQHHASLSLFKSCRLNNEACLFYMFKDNLLKKWNEVNRLPGPGSHWCRSVQSIGSWFPAVNWLCACDCHHSMF